MVAKRQAEQAAREKAEAERIKAIADNETKELEIQSLPHRQYLMKHVVPVLSEGLIEVCKVQPENPVDYLAEFIHMHAQLIADAATSSSTTDSAAASDAAPTAGT